MTSRSYEVPVGGDSTYESMRSTNGGFRSPPSRIQVKRVYRPRSSGSSNISRRTTNDTIYFAILIFILALNFACSCYIVIALENLKQTYCNVKKSDAGKTCNINDDKINQLISKTDSIMHALYYNVPQAMHQLGIQITNRYEGATYDIKTLLSKGFLELQLNLGSNKTFRITTGMRNQGLPWTTASPDRRKRNEDIPIPTLLPKFEQPKVTGGFYPLRSLETLSGEIKMSEHTKDNVKKGREYRSRTDWRRDRYFGRPG
ncbi:transmembrane protein [Meliandou praomys virus]|uniref:Transmembrane protein n=1 Tax=Meliandou praomys virus TaxID=2940988 RepID=A0AAE9HQL8_9MONO|nr:transmembrane protein [Meliandou praomys virus]